MHKLLRDTQGQAVAEFGLSLLILLPLLLWMLRLGEIMHVKQTAIESARFAAWERAYGRDPADINSLVKKKIAGATIFTRDGAMRAHVETRSGSSKSHMRTLAAGIGRSMPKALGLRFDNFYRTRVQVSGRLLRGVSYTLTENYALVSDPWHLIDQDNNHRIESSDLEETVNRIYFYPVFSARVKQVLDFAGRLQNHWIVRTLVRWSGQELDIDPRGHAKLDEVPKPAR